MIATATRLVRTGLVATAGAAALAGIVGAGTAQAATQAPAGWVSVMQCSGASGSIAYSPGIYGTTAHSTSAALSATLTGCSDAYGGVYSDTGHLSVSLSGKSSKASGTLSGTFVINWPASSGFNPSVGTATLNYANNTLTLGGTTSSGAWTGSYVSDSMLITGHKGAGTKLHRITQQSFVNTTPLTAQENFG